MSLDHLKQAREKLSPNNLSAGLPGREEHCRELYTFLFERLKIRQTTAEKQARLNGGIVANIRDRHMNKTMFVCGVPGTGKTVTIQHVINNLLKESLKKSSRIHKFKSIYINGQQLAKPDRIYSEILLKLTGLNHPPEKAQDMLGSILRPGDEEYASVQFDKKKAKKAKISPEGYVVVTVDELDLLYSDKRQSVFYNLFDWPTSANSKLVLITIANAMDLPERFMRGKISSRLGWNKLVFESYTSDCLEKIISTRLGEDLMRKTFDRAAIVVATKRIGRTTGDARRVLDTCRLAIDRAIHEKVPKVGAYIIDKVGFQNLDAERGNFVKTCPPLELHVLKSILRQTDQVGEENVDAWGVYKQFVVNLSRDEYFSTLTIGYAHFGELLNTLSGIGIIYLEADKPLSMKRMFILDSSDTFKDLIRTHEPKIELPKI